jgi:phenylacetate-coenzyme A ligase PaaK-like adenylate-forming protein
VWQRRPDDGEDDVIYPAGYEDRCHDELASAIEGVPAYASWRPIDPGPAAGLPARYAALPVITKRELREFFPDGFVRPGLDREAALRSGELEYAHTSGTTDERVTTLWNQTWWNASERASWRLNREAAAATGEHREAILTSPLNTGVRSDSGPLPMASRRLGRFLYLNETPLLSDWDEQLMNRIIEELDQFQPVVLEANPSFLARLARHAAGQGRPVYQPPLIVLTYEFPSRVLLRQIRRAFHSPVASSYGSTETGYVLMQCEAGWYHQNTDFCHIDFTPWKTEFGGPDIGRILVTPFGNPWCALFRFNVGDLVKVAPAGSCPCGRREGLTVRALEGRAADVTLTADGLPVTVNRLDEAMEQVEGLAAYQLRQNEAGDCHLLAVGGRERDLHDELRELYGPGVSFTVSPNTAIPPELSGKHRLAIRETPLDAAQFLAPHPIVRSQTSARPAK